MDREVFLGGWNDIVAHAKWSFKKDGFLKIWANGEQKVAYHPTFTYCPNCGAELVPEIYEGPPLTEMDPNGLIWGIPLQDETTEDGDLFGGPPSPPGPPLS